MLLEVYQDSIYSVCHPKALRRLEPGNGYIALLLAIKAARELQKDI